MADEKLTDLSAKVPPVVKSRLLREVTQRNEEAGAEVWTASKLVAVLLSGALSGKERERITLMAYAVYAEAVATLDERPVDEARACFVERANEARNEYFALVEHNKTG